MSRQVPRHRRSLTTCRRRQTGSAGSAVLVVTAVLTAVVAIVAGVVTVEGRAGGDEAAAAAHRAPAALPTVVLHSSGRQAPSAADEALLGDRRRPVSRSEDRTAALARATDRRGTGNVNANVDARKKRALDQKPGGQVTRTEDRTPRNPRAIARLLLARFGFSAGQFSCLNSIYVNESGWRVHANNPSSSAYGIPQALPGSKMASAGPDWQNNPVTQIRWGLGYIKARYGSPCSAWSFKQGHGWY